MNEKKALHPKGSRPVMIGDCVVGYVVGKPRSRRNWALARQRLHEIEKIIRSRHGSFVADDNASSYVTDLARAIVNERRASLAKEGRDTRNEELVMAVVGACRHWLPSLASDEVEDEAIDAVEYPRFERADVVGKRLGVTFAERQALGLKTIGCCDMTKRQRNAATEAAKVERRKSARRIVGIKSRDEYEAESVASIARSWDVSRQTIYNWRKAGDPRGLYRCDPHMGNLILGSDLSTDVRSGERPQGAASPTSDRKRLLRLAKDAAQAAPEAIGSLMRTTASAIAMHGGSAGLRPARPSDHRNAQHG